MGSGRRPGGGVVRWTASGAARSGRPATGGAEESRGAADGSGGRVCVEALRVIAKELRAPPMGAGAALENLLAAYRAGAA